MKNSPHINDTLEAWLWVLLVMGTVVWVGWTAWVAYKRGKTLRKVRNRAGEYVYAWQDGFGREQRSRYHPANEGPQSARAGGHEPGGYPSDWAPDSAGFCGDGGGGGGD